MSHLSCGRKEWRTVWHKQRNDLRKWTTAEENTFFFKLLMSFFHLYLPFFYSFLIMFLPAIIFAFVLAFSFKHWLFIPRARYDWNLKEKIMKNKSWLIQVKVTNAFQHFSVGCFQSKSHHSSQLERLRQLRKGPLRTTMHI